MKRIKKIRISERTRTIVLVILLLVGIGFLIYVQTSIDSNFVEQL